MKIIRFLTRRLLLIAPLLLIILFLTFMLVRLAIATGAYAGGSDCDTG